jgi:hypothetical protein
MLMLGKMGASTERARLRHEAKRVHANMQIIATIGLDCLGDGMSPQLKIAVSPSEASLTHKK